MLISPEQENKYLRLERENLRLQEYIVNLEQKLAVAEMVGERLEAKLFLAETNLRRLGELVPKRLG